VFLRFQFHKIHFRQDTKLAIDVPTSVILFSSTMNSTMRCQIVGAQCPTQFCHGYNATICYEQVNKTEQATITNFLCPPINLCSTTGCHDLWQLLTPAYMNLTGSNSYDINCEDGTISAVAHTPLRSSGSSIRRDTLVALIAIGISLLVCGSASI
jgi:hypothetical protein